MNFESPKGKWSLVLVGATNVGHITITLDPSITTNRWMWHAPTEREYSPPLKIQAGDQEFRSVGAGYGTVKARKGRGTLSL